MIGPGAQVLAHTARAKRATRARARRVEHAMYNGRADALIGSILEVQVQWKSAPARGVEHALDEDRQTER